MLELECLACVRAFVKTLTSLLGLLEYLDKLTYFKAIQKPAGTDNRKQLLLVLCYARLYLKFSHLILC